jgi:hypothetical protein
MISKTQKNLKRLSVVFVAHTVLCSAWLFDLSRLEWLLRYANFKAYILKLSESFPEPTQEKTTEKQYARTKFNITYNIPQKDFNEQDC